MNARESAFLFFYCWLTRNTTTLYFNTAAEERKKQEDKEYHKHYQDVLFKENQANLARKAEEKARAFAEEK